MIMKVFFESDFFKVNLVIDTVKLVVTIKLEIIYPM